MSYTLFSVQRISLYLSILVSYFSGLAQDDLNNALEIKGRVIDEQGNFIPFVNIGLAGKNIGTVSNSRGEYYLLLSDSLLDESLTFSHVAFDMLELPLHACLGVDQVSMNSRIINLEEVSIRSNELAQKKIGVKRTSMLYVMPAYIDKDIYEIAVPLELVEDDTQIVSLNMFIAKATVDSCLFRVNLYRSVKGQPGEKLSSLNIIIKTVLIDNQWNSIDLTQYKLFYNQDIFLSVEFLPLFDGNAPFQISYGAKLLKSGKAFVRQSSLGAWSMIPLNPSFNVDVSF